jgi:hypothetical protein
VRVFIELERIKKPSPLIINTCRLFCMLVNTFKDRSIEEDIESW